MHRSVKDPDFDFLKFPLDVWIESCASNGCTTWAVAVRVNRQNIRVCAQRNWLILALSDGVGPTSTSSK